MPVPRCDTCGRVLNSDGSCTNEIECKKYEQVNCSCGHDHWRSGVSKQKKSNKKTDNNKAS